MIAIALPRALAGLLLFMLLAGLGIVGLTFYLAYVIAHKGLARWMP